MSFACFYNIIYSYQFITRISFDLCVFWHSCIYQTFLHVNFYDVALNLKSMLEKQSDIGLASRLILNVECIFRNFILCSG